MARQGVVCSVIAPIRLFDMLRAGRREIRISYDESIDGNPIKLIRPHFLSFSKKRLFGINTGQWTYWRYRKACDKAIQYVDFPINVVFGHFLYPGGATAAHLGRRLGIPAFVRVGESGDWSVSSVAVETARQEFRIISGMVANSSAIAQRMVTDLEIPPAKILTEANGVDRGLFYPRDRHQIRARLGVSHERFLIAFVGHFDERKGPNRLLAAVQGLADVGLIFIGAGPIPLEDSRIVHKGRVLHEQVPEYLSAADIFVLPTLAEGSCNAVLEALACGLPVVSSNREFNWGAVDETCGILVEPTDIHQIRDAILALKENHAFRERLREGALKRAKELDIDNSAGRILDWFKAICTAQSPLRTASTH